MKKIFVYILQLVVIQQLCAQQPGYYNNPILAGFYPDPSICRAGEDYYIVNSSFAYYPGLPIFHSKDLVNWKQIGHALDRPEQLPLIGAGVSRGLFAPSISYYKGTFYIVCTLIDRGGNFVITAKDPAGPWSNPVYLKEVNGIDPSLFFDESTDKAYMIYNSDPPNRKTLWNGHRTIRMYEFDYNNKKVIGEELLLVNGGVDTSKHPVWIEAPHIYRIKNQYYLMCAEGGTGYNHSEVIFRSDSPKGPFIPWKENPILTQRHLDRGRKNPITTAGHADLVETPQGEWYAVFLACRPYEGDHYNIGRETFLTPVTWTADGWPVITKGDELVKFQYPFPKGVKGKANNQFTGNFTYRDDFSKKALDVRYTFLRTVTENWYSTSAKGGWLELALRPHTVGGRNNPSFVGFRQHHHEADASTKLKFSANAENEKAGLVVFQNETHYYYLAKSVEKGKPVVQLYQSGKDSSTQLLASAELPGKSDEVYLKISPDKATYTMSYSLDGSKWTTLKAVDGRFLSTATAGGFVGCVFGLYATSNNLPSTAKAYFDWFQYKGNDEVFRN